MSVVFVGCDAGGWHTKNADAAAVCRYDRGAWWPAGEESGSLFYPVGDHSLLTSVIARAESQGDRVIIAIDASLGWPVRFTDVVIGCSAATHVPDFNPANGAIMNPYLYRETDRFIAHRVLAAGEIPLTAPGDKLGNVASKAQAFVAWLKERWPSVYRPPFDPWELEIAGKCPILDYH